MQSDENFHSSSAAGKLVRKMTLGSLWDEGTTIKQAYIADIGRKTLQLTANMFDMSLFDP